MALPLWILALVILAIVFVVIWLVSALVFFAAGRVVSGMNTKFTDAMIVSLIGAIANGVLQALFRMYVRDPLVAWLGSPLLGDIVTIAIVCLIVLIVYIPLIMHFFDTGLGGAILVGLLVIVFSIVLIFFIVVALIVLALI